MVGFLISSRATKYWLNEFLEERLRNFGPYEDAIAPKENILYHSGLTPMLNTGIITPQEIVDAVLDYGREHKVPVNSLEGFIRQIIGWREFMRMVYIRKGSYQRTHNFWKFENRKLPESLYIGE